MIQIAIVDDESDTHLLYKLKLKKLFANHGAWELISFLNAYDCIDYLSQNNPPKIDLILTDINMPGMDGFEFLEKVQALTVKIPVYMISAYESVEFRKKANKLGVAHFLSKPVDFHLLSHLVKKDLGV